MIIIHVGVSVQGTHVCKSMDGTEFLNPEKSPGGIPSQDITDVYLQQL